MNKCTFWKFVSHPISTTNEQAAELAKCIASGDVIPINNHGERFYKSGGYCYDLGRKPYLVEYSHGHIQRSWALSVTELRRALYLKRNDKVINDPFYKGDELDDHDHDALAA